MARRKNPSTTTWLLLLGGGAVVFYLATRKGGIGGYQIGPGGRGVFWKPEVGPGGQVRPPPTPTAKQREAMERGFRYRPAHGKCFDYKDRRYVDSSYCG